MQFLLLWVYAVLVQGKLVKRDKLSLFALVSVWFGLCQASFGRSNPSVGDKCSLYISVHEWMVRHIYFPCLRNGIPKGVAMMISFFIYVVSMRFHWSYSPTSSKQVQ